MFLVSAVAAISFAAVLRWWTNINSQGPGWDYETELPGWASVEWSETEWDF